MVTLTTEQIIEKYKEFEGMVEEHLEGEVLDSVKKIISHFESRLVESPASGRLDYHNCFVGGFIDHTVRVAKTALKMKKHFEGLGVEVIHSDSDVFLAAAFHDWGKLGDLDIPYYIEQKSEWHRNKLGEFYTRNPELEYMTVTDRSLWMLQEFNVKISPAVWKAIKMSDGMFEAGNETYFRSPSDTRNILHYIVHFADWSSTIAEKQHHVQGEVIQRDEEEKAVEKFKEQLDIPETTSENTTEEKRPITSDAAKDLFDELFGDKS